MPDLLKSHSSPVLPLRENSQTANFKVFQGSNVLLTDFQGLKFWFSNSRTFKVRANPVKSSGPPPLHPLYLNANKSTHPLKYDFLYWRVHLKTVLHTFFVTNHFRAKWRNFIYFFFCFVVVTLFVHWCLIQVSSKSTFCKWIQWSHYIRLFCWFEVRSVCERFLDVLWC